MESNKQSIVVNNQHYPIQIKSWKVSKGDKVKKDQPLGMYEYLETIESESFTRRAEIRIPYEGTIENLVEKDFIARNEQEVLGYIKEYCSHSVQLAGLCALCGKDLTISDYIGSDMQRATINLTHDSKGVKISQKEAIRIDKITSNRLLKQRKLSLLLDLDQTVVHATVDQTVQQWLDNPENPEFPTIKDVHQFLLGPQPPVYYIKLRPGTMEFLEYVHEKYEMHIYTMGTRNYAHSVAQVLDPDKKYFKDRILSRDDSGSFEFKSIQRLFPSDQSMVVAIDDRADVWRWSHNLIKVRPYNFFLGIGDINEPMKDGQLAESVEPKQKPKPVMVDDDRDLLYIENALDTLHKRFYEIVDRGEDESDVRTILPVIKLQVLLDVHLVFSGIIPLGQTPESHELWIMATQFGAKCYTELDSQVTHVIAKKDGTAKVRQAQELEYVWVVKVEWLIDCLTQWKRLKEDGYLLDPNIKPVMSVAPIGDDVWNEVDEFLGSDSSSGVNEDYADEQTDPISYNAAQKTDDLSDLEEDDDWLANEIDAEIDNQSDEPSSNVVLGKRSHDQIE